MHTDERHEPPGNASDSPDDGGIRARLRGLLRNALAGLRDALGADSLSVPAGEGEWDELDSEGLPDRDSVDNATDAPQEGTRRAGSESGELTVSRAEGRLRVSDGEGAYIESDTWEEVER